MSVSGIGSSGSTSSSASASSNLATNVGPISFPGISSGLDYSSIIAKLTGITAAEETPLQAKVTNFTAENSEITKITGLLTTLQTSLSALSNANTFNAFSASSSNTAIVNATQVPGQIVTPGNYTITSATVGSATQVVSANTGHALKDNLSGTPSTNIPLVDSYIQIPPTNGTATAGSITVNGVSVSYDVSSQSLSTILANIQSAVRSGTGDGTFTASYSGATDQVTFKSTADPVTIGSPNDSGNLAQVLKLDVAQITNTANSGTVTSAYGIGGINEYENLSSNNPQGNAVDANVITAVTAGTFSINGVTFTVSPTSQALSDIITNINNSSAGVIANFNQESGAITLANKTAGATSIVLGASTDTSNFLKSVGLVANGGYNPTTTVGTQTVVSYTDTAGSSHTVYTNGNAVTNAIPGLSLNINANTTSPVTITVAQTATPAETAINTFVTAYNNVINEINQATVAPVVTQSTTSKGVAATAIGGGVLFGNSQVAGIKNQLVALVSSLQTTGSTSYNSLGNIGLKLDSSFTVLSSSGSGNSGTSGISAQSYKGTDGQFTALDTTDFEAAFAANPNAVASIFTGASNFVNQIGTYLTQVTGNATQVATGLAGTAPVTSTLAAITNQNTNIIEQTNTQIAHIQAQVTAQANLLTTEFNASEAQLQKIQSQQSYLSQLSSTSS